MRLESAADGTWAELARTTGAIPCHRSGRSPSVLDDAVHWLSEVPESCLHAIVTDAPNGLIEYSRGSSGKNPAGRGGVWRIPPSFGGAKRSPLPRVTILKPRAIEHLQSFFSSFAHQALREFAPGPAPVRSVEPVAFHNCLLCTSEGRMRKARRDSRREPPRIGTPCVLPSPRTTRCIKASGRGVGRTRGQPRGSAPVAS